MMKRLMTSLAMLGAVATLAGCYSSTKEKTIQPAVVETPSQNSSSSTTTTTTTSPAP